MHLLRGVAFLACLAVTDYTGFIVVVVQFVPYISAVAASSAHLGCIVSESMGGDGSRVRPPGSYILTTGAHPYSQ